MAQSFLQSAGRAFARTAPTAGELLRLSQGNRLLTLQESLARTAADQLRIDKAAIKLFADDDTQTVAELKDEATALETVKEFGDILKIPAGILKPSLNAFVTRVEQQVGKPLSPLFKEVVAKGKQEDLQALANVITRNALADPDFNSEKLAQAVTSDDITMTTLMQVGQQVSSERQATKDAEVPGAVQPPKFPEIESRLARNKKKIVQLQRRRDRKAEKRNRVIEAGAKPNIIKIFTDAVNKFDTQIKGVENEIGEDLRFLEGKGFSRGERIAGQEFRTGEREAGQDFRTGEREAGETFTAGQNVISAEKGSPLAKLQLRRGSLETRLTEGRASGKLSQKAEDTLIKQIEEVDARITKDSTIVGRTSADFAAALNMTESDVSQLQTENRSRRIGVELLAASRSRVRILLDSKPDANTLLAKGVVLVRNIGQNAKALARQLDIDISEVHLDPATYTGEWVGGLGEASVELQTIGLNMAFALAVAKNQTGKALSDSDLVIFMRMLGLTADDPALMLRSLDTVVSLAAEEARIFFNELPEGLQGTGFKQFSFEKGGTPIPGVTGIVKPVANPKTAQILFDKTRNMSEAELRKLVKKAKNPVEAAVLLDAVLELRKKTVF